jgi:hypothetical protein
MEMVTEAGFVDADLLLDYDQIVSEAATTAAVLFWDRAQQQPELSGFRPELAVDVLLPRPPLLMRHSMGLKELACSFS